MRRLLALSLLALALVLGWSSDSDGRAGRLCVGRGVCHKAKVVSCVATAVTLDPAHKGADIVLSGSNLIATLAGAIGDEAVHATQSFSTGKIYIEGKGTAGSASHLALVGWANSAMGVGPGYYLGSDNNSLGFDAGTGQFILNNVFTNADAAPPGTGTAYGLAVDLVNKLAWETHDGVSWNTGLAGTQNPATGQGGFSFATIAAGPYFPAISMGNDTVTDSITVSYGGSSFAYSAPSGFSPPFVPCSGPAPQPPPSPAPTFYVATNGSDANDGLAPTTGGGHGPFLTFGACQAAMRNSATVKTCTVRGGTYNFATGFTLSGPTDNGQTWQFYSADGVCTAHIDGANGGNILFTVAASNVTVNGLQFQNNGDAEGLVAIGANHNGIGFATDSDLFENNCAINFGNVNSPAIGVWGATNVKMFNNLVNNTNSKAMSCEATQNGDLYSGCDIENNILTNTNTGNPDNGAIYMQDRNNGGGQSTNITIKNNYIRDYGSVANFNKGIYHDDGASNTTSTLNVISGLGQFCTQFHGGDNNHLNNNICDLGANGNQWMLFYQSSPTQTVANMAGNQLEGNLILNCGSVTPTTYNTNISGQLLPTVTANDYFSYGTAGTNSSSSGITDTNPQHVNPQISGAAYTIAGGSPVFSAPINYPPVPAGYGPPGTVIQASGAITINGVTYVNPGTARCPP